ncbi:putative bifunctional diguanylate cyclase/phosphodiesterase [Undibacterium sp. Di24W]
MPAHIYPLPVIEKSADRCGNEVDLHLFNEVSRDEGVRGDASIFQANKDALTSLPNRFWLMNHLRTCVTVTQVQSMNIALIFVDLNEFRDIKYTFGHVLSEELLREVSLRLSALLKSGDYLARLSYGEFIFLLSDVSHVQEVRDMAEQISTSLRQPFELRNNRRHLVQASIGISLYPEDAKTGEELLKHADIAMYKAKGQVRESFLFYQASMSAAILAKMTIEHALNGALDRDEFTVHYQPRVDSTGGELRGLEALIRWDHPERGMVPPVDFIAIAESSGLIVQIGERVIEMVCQQVALWQAQAYPQFPVSINVSARQLDVADFQSRLIRHTSAYGIDPVLIEIEVTESCIVNNEDDVRHQLNALSKLGMKILLDDFGTGYSSLSKLQLFQMDILKIDRSFISALDVSGKGHALVAAIIAMAHAIDMKVIAEGVETIEQLRQLQAMSCDEVQGYLISKPLKATDIEQLFCKSSWFAD